MLVYMLTLGGILIVNVTIYSIHMDPMGYIYIYDIHVYSIAAILS